jgi:multiple sugar transport system ATP-binding protein
MATVTYSGATRTYTRGGPHAVDSLDLNIGDGEFLVLVGPSGSGKTTALRMLAGLEPIDEGHILIDGHDITQVSSKDRDIAMVFQNYALYPRKTVADNMAFPLKMHGVAKEERNRRVLGTAQMLGLGDLLDRKPRSLSGGQRQRVAMGRALVREPRVFLMDEPLSNLDAKLRVQTRSHIAQLQRRIGVTTVYVTHDQAEAMTLGHRVAVLHNGVLQQCATPRALYDDPANRFVAGFIGSPSMNLCEVAVEAGAAILAGGLIPLPENLAAATASRTKVILGIRPEHLSLGQDSDTAGTISGQVIVVEELGADTYLHVRLANEEDRQMVIRVDGRLLPKVDEEIWLRLPQDQLYAFDAVTGARLG